MPERKKSLWAQQVKMTITAKAEKAARDLSERLAQNHGDQSLYTRLGRAAYSTLKGRADRSGQECFEHGRAAFEQGKLIDANYWFLLAVRRGHSGAMNNLGVLCFREEKFDEAAQWYRLAADDGNSIAAKNLGILLLGGFKGVPADRKEALRLLHVAADRGDTEAKARLYDEEAAGKGNTGGGGEPERRSRKMNRAEALEIFELKEGATRDQIKAAYVRLVQHVHPDKGGSNYFARELNQARDLLLG